MEKLQKALIKAREKRENGDAPAAPAARPRNRITTTGSPAWKELEQISLDPEFLQKKRIVTLTANKAATAFDILRTKVLLQMRENGWKRLAITSPHPSCGKTTTACNLAVGITRQPDISAMLFDLDMRQPGVAKTLGYKPETNIDKVFDGSVPFSEQAVRLEDNLALSLARSRRSDPTSLLLNRRTAEVLDAIEERYQPDLMIFDLPPLLTGDDTRAFLKNVDCALLVARAEVTKVGQADTTEKEIAKYTNVLGLVLNGCRYGAEAEEYSYY